LLEIHAGFERLRVTRRINFRPNIGEKESNAGTQTMDSVAGQPRKKFVGILERKPRWGLTAKGWLVVVMLAVVAGLTGLCCLRPFLAVTQRVETRTLAVEGWSHDYAFEAAAKEFKTGAYDRVFATGGPIVGQGGYINDAHTYASIGAQKLVAFGIPKECVQMAPSRVIARDRTYGSAEALRDWLKAHNLTASSLNVMTEECHARRSRLLFQEAFGPEVKVGIISVPNPDYDPRYWWRYSDGVRDVIDESVAYLYAKFFFWPAKEKAEIGN
jgi:hypothetical protein